MRVESSRLVMTLLLAALAAAQVDAQSLARSFGDLQKILEPSTVVFVTDTAGRETWGRVVELSDARLTLALLQQEGSATVTTGESRTFTEAEVALILRADSTGRRGEAIYPASWHRVSALPADSPITVVLEGGDRRDYRLGSVDAARIDLVTPAGQAESLAKERIQRVLRAGIDDSVGNGIAIGALAGAGGGLAVIAISKSQCGPTCNDPSNEGALMAMFTGMSVGIGAVAGWLIDKSRKGTEVLYPVGPPRPTSVTVAPVLTPNAKGIAVAVRF